MSSSLPKRAVVRLVDAAGSHPWVVLLMALLAIAGTWGYARKLELRPDFLELLPRDSPGFRAYEHQLGRVGGGASFTFVVESPDRKANEKFIDEIAARLDKKVKDHAACEAACKDDACKHACGENYILYFESGTKDVQTFYRSHKWLFASQQELEEADATLDHQIAIRSGLVSDFGEDETTPSDAGAPLEGGTIANTPEKQAPNATADPDAGADAGATTNSNAKKPALGLDVYNDKWTKSSNKYDDFPTGYFASDDGTTMVLRVISRASGSGGNSGDIFTAEMKQLVADINPTSLNKDMRIGYAGDIPNAKEEKESIVNEAVWAVVIASLLSLAGIVVYFRSLWSLVVVFVPVFVGVGSAYAFATAAFGYVNTAGAFLGAIIVGNGINYPIVLLARYREFRARGMEPADARRDAVLNAFRAELVGAAVAGIAYGSLIVTRFRGFNQFGAIGFLGMLLVWASIIPIVPALVVIIERIQARLPKLLRDPAPRIREDGTRGPFIRAAAFLTEKYPVALVLLGVVVTIGMSVKLPQFIRDPWEYDFHNLGSKSSKVGGAGEWSSKADRVFQGKTDISGVRMLADSAEQVPLVKAQILANDAKDPEGKLIDKIVTIDEFLPGTVEEQKAKLVVLDRIRDRLTDRVIYDLEPDEQKRVLNMKPPEGLVAITGKDLPHLMRHRFEENDGRVGTMFYAQYKFGVSQGDGHTALRIAATTDNIVLPDGTLVQTASRATVYAEMIKSMQRDGPLATLVSFLMVVVVVIVATHNVRGAFATLLSLVMAVTITVGGAALFDHRLNFLNFIALPITFGIGCEYPFNIYDRTRILHGDITSALKRSGGAVVLCSYTTIIGYGSLLVADQQAVQSFGKLAVSGELACISMAIFFLPSLLHVLSRRSKSTS